jgi:CheY-like chemotaxis protein
MSLVMTVDDAAFQRRQLSKFLLTNGFEIIEATNGVEALEKLQTADVLPSVIISDLLMPEMNGLEFIRTMQDQGVGIPVIVLSADIQESTRDEVEELEVVDFVHKPFTHKDNQARLLAALDKAIPS